jgi:hypothetical protein
MKLPTVMKGIPLPKLYQRWTPEQHAAMRAWWTTLGAGMTFELDTEDAMRTMRTRVRYYCRLTWGPNRIARRRAEGRLLQVTWPTYTWRKLPDGRYRCWVLTDVGFTEVDPSQVDGRGRVRKPTDGGGHATDRT